MPCACAIASPHGSSPHPAFKSLRQLHLKKNKNGVRCLKHLGGLHAALVVLALRCVLRLTETVRGYTPRPVALSGFTRTALAALAKASMKSGQSRRIERHRVTQTLLTASSSIVTQMMK
jgi:hypothetical protein